jgi:hypothetical protein
MSRTAAATLAQVKVRHPQWTVLAVLGGYSAERWVGQDLHAVYATDPETLELALDARDDPRINQQGAPTCHVRPPRRRPGPQRCPSWRARFTRWP